MKANKNTFTGFSLPRYTQVPDELFDDLMNQLSGAELKVLLYIIRRTFGFKKESDTISLSQICSGITTREGQIIDKGTGLSLSSVQQAIKGLIQKHCVIAIRNRSKEKGDMPTTYSLNIRTNRPATDNQQGGIPIVGNGGYRKPITQETLEQETDLHLRNSKANSQEQSEEAEKTTAARKGSINSVADILAKRQPQLAPSRAPTKKFAPTPQIIVAITEISEHFRDTSHLRSNTTQAVNLWQASARSEASFVSTLYEAQSITKQQARVQRPMPYFWRVVRDLLDLQQESLHVSDA